MISYPVGNSGQTLVLTEAVLKHFEHHRQLAAEDREAGGQLFAKFDGGNVIVERATGPRPSDRRSLLSFIPDRIAERREIRGLFKLGLHYVGDWHTHSEPQPQPSTVDAWSLRDIFRRSKHQLDGFVMIIVGNASIPESLYVGIGNKDCIQRLNRTARVPEL